MDLSSMQNWLGIFALLGGMISFGVAIMLIPLIKWIHDVQSRAVDAERNIAQMYMQRTEIIQMLDNLKRDLNNALSTMRGEMNSDINLTREDIKSVRDELKLHDARATAIHESLKNDFYKMLTLKRNANESER